MKMIKKFIQNIVEIRIGNEYERDELYALSDWFAEEKNVLFGSTIEGHCFRAEPAKIGEDEWIVKDFWLRNLSDEEQIRLEELETLAKERYNENSDWKDVLDMLDEDELAEYYELKRWKK